MSRPFLKLCGLHSEEDVQLAVESDADYVGFVMARSKREVKPEDAALWLQRYQFHKKEIVLLFVNATSGEIQVAADQLSPDIIQCHGTESVEEIKKIKQTTGTKVWKAIPHDEGSLNKMMEYTEAVDGFIVDAKAKHAWGGTGESFDWSHVPKYVAFGQEKQLPVFIAGGITAENVDNVLAYDPWGIDLSSGIEANGKKDKHRLMELEKRLKEYEQNISR
ncbi:phosphoribosylanthranilate isomerase [Salibacterium salarium]|uniref:phosphoribosylanthranilate isomerase n=1 Tax=Salibacterium salarium TaxID=284579 RepID=UPI002789F16F|nr:phosphoribosylanthranilate isomerase [Salibacterium salarium]MDQ0299432.1 phosphoribosylanthranilate isomerase [Salibacterium salarium]